MQSAETTRPSVSRKWKWKSPSRVWLFATPWTIQSMEFSRPEYWSGWPFPSPGDLPNPGIESRSPTLQANSLLAEPQGKPKNTGVGSLSLPNPGIKLGPQALQADSLPTELLGKPHSSYKLHYLMLLCLFGCACSPKILTATLTLFSWVLFFIKNDAQRLHGHDAD